MEPVLFINACVRKESRTRVLAHAVLEKLGMPYGEVRVHGINFPVADEAFLNKRDRLLAEGDLADPVFDHARRFAGADTVVIAAPYWDLSFPAALKQYFEQINVTGITFRYGPDGAPVGLCKAKKLIYVTTAGGFFAPEDYGFGYIEALARNFYGIPDVRLIKAVGLDIDGADTAAIMEEAKRSVEDSDIG